MHEVGLMQQALDVVLDCAAGRGAGRILGVRLRVGLLSGVVPDALAFAFAALTPGTPAEGARLDIERVPALCRCADCNREYSTETYDYLCPHCGQTRIEILGGREFEVASITVEDHV